VLRNVNPENLVPQSDEIYIQELEEEEDDAYGGALNLSSSSSSPRYIRSAVSRGTDSTE
jgi:hypothetical protein